MPTDDFGRLNCTAKRTGENRRDENVASSEKGADADRLMFAKRRKGAFAVMVGRRLNSIAVSEEVDQHDDQSVSEQRDGRSIDDNSTVRIDEPIVEHLLFRQIVLLYFCVESFQADAEDLRRSVLVPIHDLQDAGNVRFFQFCH